jgi:hypothetical protein
MQDEVKCTSCTKQVELMLLTREEDYKELNAKIAEVQRIQSKRIQALDERIAALEYILAKSWSAYDVRGRTSRE